jgi:hypothetical protein
MVIFGLLHLQLFWRAGVTSAACAEVKLNIAKIGKSKLIRPPRLMLS